MQTLPCRPAFHGCSWGRRAPGPQCTSCILLGAWKVLDAEAWPGRSCALRLLGGRGPHAEGSREEGAGAGLVEVPRFCSNAWVPSPSLTPSARSPSVTRKSHLWAFMPQSRNQDEEEAQLSHVRCSLIPPARRWRQRRGAAR